MLLDVEYVLLGMPGVLAAIWAWGKTVAARTRAGREPSLTGLSGVEAARCVLLASGLAEVPIEEASGPLADHYEAGRRRLRLSPAVHEGRSRAAVAMAAHEAGHAIQEAAGSPWIWLRRICVPLADLGSILVWILLPAGVVLGIFRMTLVGLAVVALSLLVQLLNLGAEKDASRRALDALKAAGRLSDQERAAMAQGLRAAEWAHVASVLSGFPAFLASCLPWSPQPRQVRG